MDIATEGYDQNVFINCPFDVDYRPLLEAILFCIIDCDLTPRIATERLDSGEVRLDKIVELIRASRFSIHDLSRIRPRHRGDIARLNMPFELGVDYGISIGGQKRMGSKRILVIAEDKYLYQAAISDIAGWDIRSHAGRYEQAIGQVRSWLHSHRRTDRPISRIIGDYTGFQEWDYERLLASGWSDRDIQERETGELLETMIAWRDADRPASFS